MGEPMVYEAARPHFKALAKLSAELNKASDRYTEELKSIEAELQKSKLGLECFLRQNFEESEWQIRDTDIENRDGEIITEHYFTELRLGFGRCRHEWRLLVREYEIIGNPQERETWSWVQVDQRPLLDEARDVRIAVAEHIPILLATLEKEAQKKLDTLKKVTDRKS